MSRIKGKHTKIERSLQSALRKLGFRFKLHHPIFGHPDIVFLEKKVAVFVDGCFWHKCPKHYIKPATRKSFWETKISENVRRDRIVTKRLKAAGWRVLRFWEHDLERNLKSVVGRITSTLKRKLH